MFTLAKLFFPEPLLIFFKSKRKSLVNRKYSKYFCLNIKHEFKTGIKFFHYTNNIPHNVFVFVLVEMLYLLHSMDWYEKYFINILYKIFGKNTIVKYKKWDFIAKRNNMQNKTFSISQIQNVIGLESVFENQNHNQ